MKTKITFLASSLAVLALAVTLNMRADDSEGDGEKRVLRGEKEDNGWQHLALQHEAEGQFSDRELAQKINKLGRDGWEMVTVLNFNEEGTTKKTVYYFKKPL